MIGLHMYKYLRLVKTGLIPLTSVFQIAISQSVWVKVLQLFQRKLPIKEKSNRNSWFASAVLRVNGETVYSFITSFVYLPISSNMT